MHIPDNRVLLRGLSMPHSPRWYRAQLWLLESGQGTLARVDVDPALPTGGTVAPVAYLPGFTRGLDFMGPLAFVGLSQVRGSVVFSDLPLLERCRERYCGIWVVNIETGQTVASLQFEAQVQGIFAVQILPGVRHPAVLDWAEAGY